MVDIIRDDLLERPGSRKMEQTALLNQRNRVVPKSLSKKNLNFRDENLSSETTQAM